MLRFSGQCFLACLVKYLSPFKAVCNENVAMLVIAFSKRVAVQGRNADEKIKESFLKSRYWCNKKDAIVRK
jgi:hypothetical protein